MVEHPARGLFDCVDWRVGDVPVADPGERKELDDVFERVCDCHVAHGVYYGMSFPLLFILRATNETIRRLGLWVV